jgi:hypothetical protein
MSDLGQKRTCQAAGKMSALSLKADMGHRQHQCLPCAICRTFDVPSFSSTAESHSERGVSDGGLCQPILMMGAFTGDTLSAAAALSVVMTRLRSQDTGWAPETRGQNV